MDTSVAQILQGLESGLPLLLLHFGATLALFLIGVAVYVAVTPLHERELLASGNQAPGGGLGGPRGGLGIPRGAPPRPRVGAGRPERGPGAGRGR
ncbi:hypothetical protein GAY28_11090 [Azospirillum brasilense]|nr:hypothetical protein [Azospirillum brasilense]